MDEIVSLVKFVSSQRTQQIDLFSSRDSLPFKTRLLYDAILNSQVNSDEDALELLYKGDISKRRSYLKLKNRLRKRLLNTLVFVDTNKRDLTDRRKVGLELGRFVVIMNILWDRLQHKLCLPLAKKQFARAVKFEYAKYAVELGEYILYYYGVVAPDLKKFNAFKKQMIRVREEMEFEIRSTEIYSEVSIGYTTNVGLSKTYLNEMKEFCLELESQQKRAIYIKANLRAYNIRSSFALMIKNYDKAIDIAEEAIKYVEGKKFATGNVTNQFVSNLIIASISLGNYKLANQYSDKIMPKMGINSVNWYIQRNYRFIIFTGLEDYQSLYSLTLEVVNSKNYKKFTLQNEYWKVIEAYIQFMIRLGVIDPSLDESGLELKPFRLNKFLNEVPKYSKDKRGLNVSILVVQFLFLLLDKKYDAIIDRADALKQYTYRYLKNDETFRSNLFLKLLIKVIEQDFHPVAVERHTQKLFARLHETKRNTDFQSNQLEIIPYEKMWEFVQQLLEKNYREG